MEFEKLKKIIVDVLNVDENEITMDTTFIDDLGADSLDVFRSLWDLRKNLILRFQTSRQKKIVTVGDAVEQIKAAMNEN